MSPDALKIDEEKKEERKEEKINFVSVDTKNPEGVDPLKDLLAKTEISLILDNYDDIFSDFDPRPYSQRALSDDFITEARKAAIDKTGTLELRFLVPSNLRKTEHESVIKRRIRDYFKRHVVLLETDSKHAVRKGFLIAFLGFLLMMLSTTIRNLELSGFLFDFLIVVFEPAGWFIVWFGLEEIFYKGREKKNEIVFSKKMGRANITFSSY
jgi:hypothetical protein